MVKRSTAVVLVLVLFVASVYAAGCGQGNDVSTTADNKPQAGGILRYPLQDDPTSLDPAQFGDELSVDVGKELFDGLVEIDFTTNKVIPAHAEKWEIKDNKVFTFYLRKGTKFHNGREVTADDFKYSFERLLDPNTGSVVSWILANVKGAEARMAGQATDTTGIKVIDKYTLEITLEKPSPAFLSGLAYPGAAVVDQDSVEKAKAGGKPFAATGAGPEVVVGSGPFKLAQWTPKNVIKIVRNDDYYGQKPYLNGVDFKIIPDETTTLNEFRAGNLDFIDRIPPGQAGIVEQEFGNQAAKDIQWQVEFYALNVAQAPFKDNVKLRQAMNYAINREGIIKAICEGLGTPANGVLPAGMPEYNQNLKGYTYDVTKAKSLIAEAGYPEGKGLNELELVYNNNRETNQKIAEAVQAQLAEVGIKIKLNGLPLPEYQKAMGSGSLSFFKLGWVADSLDAGSILNPLFYSKGDFNMTGYANPQVDRLLEEAQTTTDEKQRISLYQQAEQLIVNDAPVVLLYHPESLTIRGKNINGLVGNPMDRIPLSGVWISRS